MKDYKNDERIVMTLDAGGTNLVFGAIGQMQEVVKPVRMPSCGDNLEKCIEHIKQGFKEVMIQLPLAPHAISFAFPGPADYPNGIIGDLKNLPAFKGGVPLKAILEEEFGIPVFINNDGDLYAYGEALCGFLPMINKQLQEAGSAKQFKNLIGFTLGTGFGGGIVCNGQLYIGDNSAGTEVWLLSSCEDNSVNIEEEISIRAVCRNYKLLSGETGEITPKDVYEIAKGTKTGNRNAALEAYKKLGTALGYALTNILTITDSLAVIGGGVSGAAQLFMPAMFEAMNENFTAKNGGVYPRLVQKVFNLEDPSQMTLFAEGERKSVFTPSGKEIVYDTMSRIGVGISRIGTEKAISLGAYAYALGELDAK